MNKLTLSNITPNAIIPQKYTRLKSGEEVIIYYIGENSIHGTWGTKYYAATWNLEGERTDYRAKEDCDDLVDYIPEVVEYANIYEMSYGTLQAGSYKDSLERCREDRSFEHGRIGTMKRTTKSDGSKTFTFISL